MTWRRPKPGLPNILLYNITNEFKVYSSLLDKGLPRDNLFAMLVYKNIYPEDFVALGNNEGKLYQLLQQKSIYVKEHTTRIDEKIKQNKTRLEDLKFTMLKDGDELRRLYIAKFVDGVAGFGTFTFANKSYNIWEASTAEAFEYFKKGNFKYTYHYNNGGWYNLGTTNANFNFGTFEDEVDDENSYEERLEKNGDLIIGATDKIKQDIQTLEKQKAEVRHVKLKDVFTDRKSTELIDLKSVQGQLLSIMLREGYIGEDYLDYISLFYEGSLSKINHAFFINVKSQSQTEYDTALVKCANLIAKIRPIEFSEPYLLNYNLLDFMLANEGYGDQLGRVLSQVNYGNDYGVAFMDGFMSNGVNTTLFIKELLHVWPGLWKYVDERSDFTEERKEEYFIIRLY